MAITKEELDELIEAKALVEKVSTISSDGKTFVTRIPKEVIEELKISKGDKIRWIIDDDKKLEIKLEKTDGSNEKEKNN